MFGSQNQAATTGLDLHASTALAGYRKPPVPQESRVVGNIDRATCTRQCLSASALKVHPYNSLSHHHRYQRRLEALCFLASLTADPDTFIKLHMGSVPTNMQRTLALVPLIQILCFYEVQWFAPHWSDVNMHFENPSSLIKQCYQDTPLLCT